MACSHWTDRSNRTGTIGSNGYYGLWPCLGPVWKFLPLRCGKVMFLPLCVILFTGGVSGQEYLSGGCLCPWGGGLCRGDPPPVRLRAGGMHSCILVYMVSYFPFNPCTSPVPVPVPVQCECTTSAVCEPRADVLICDMLSLKCGHIALFFYFPGGRGGGLVECMAGKTATAADSTHPTGKHSCAP